MIHHALELPRNLLVSRGPRRQVQRNISLPCSRRRIYEGNEIQVLGLDSVGRDDEGVVGWALVLGFLR